MLKHKSACGDVDAFNETSELLWNGHILRVGLETDTHRAISHRCTLKYTCEEMRQLYAVKLFLFLFRQQCFIVLQYIHWRQYF